MVTKAGSNRKIKSINKNDTDNIIETIQIGNKSKVYIISIYLSYLIQYFFSKTVLFIEHNRIWSLDLMFQLQWRTHENPIIVLVIVVVYNFLNIFLHQNIKI